MKFRSLIAAGLLAAIATAAAAPGAGAATTGSTTATFTVTNGALAIVVPSGSVALGTTANTITGGYTISGLLGATTVSDNRNNTSGWTAYANSSNFVGDDAAITTDVIVASAVNMKVLATNISAQSLGVTSITQGVGTQLFVPTVGVQGTGSGNGGSIGATTANLATLVGTTLIANNSVTYNPTITVQVPPNTPNANYSGTITQTVV